MTGGQCETRQKIFRCTPGIFVLFLFILFICFPAAAETTELSISLPETVRGYTPC